MNRFFILCISLLIFGCKPKSKLVFEAKLPKHLEENSGLIATGENSYWTIEDSGNADEIYNVNGQGKLLRTLKVKNANNRDWEDLARDDQGNVYIGDFGNNGNSRKDLAIYKIPDPEIEKGEKIDSEKIEFHYPEQKKFPPQKKDRLYDTEAFFYRNDSLFIITKNRTVPFTGEALIYKIPAKKGNHTAERIGSFKLCTESIACMVTSADISPDGKTFVLLGYGRLWIFKNYKREDIGLSVPKVVTLTIGTQLESVCFKDNRTLLLSDERNGNSGGNLYSYKLK